MTKSQIALFCATAFIGACASTTSPQAAPANRATSAEPAASTAAAPASIREDGWLLRCYNSEDREYTVPIRRIVPEGDVQRAFFELEDGRRVTGRFGAGITCMYVAPIANAAAPPAAPAPAVRTMAPPPIPPAEAMPGTAPATKAPAPRPAPLSQPPVRTSGQGASGQGASGQGAAASSNQSAAMAAAVTKAPARPDTARAVATTAAPLSGPFVQFGALASPEEASLLWSSVLKAIPSFEALKPRIERADVSGKAYHRLRVYTDTKSDAANVCRRAKSSGFACWQG